MVYAMKDTKMIAELEARASELEAEAHRYRKAAAVLRGTEVESQVVRQTKAADGKGPATGTTSMALTVLKSEDRPLGPPELAAKMFAQGWQTDSANPTNVLRTSLRKLVERGQLIVSDGRYSVTDAD